MPNGQLFRESEFRHDRYFRYSWWYWFWLREAWVGQVEVDKTRTYRLIVENIGEADLRVSISSSDSAFQVESTGVTVRPGRKQLIAVTFPPTQTGRHSAKLTLTSNDSDEGALTVSVLGTGEN